ncbi:uncharacterized protein LOC107779276 [Nicotiana tabacum]|uniref:uncharacterized protein LOC107779276 n=1 Tax=Nicotiana tabacum TaxID=4097 RepID=UPI003F4E8EB9
MQFLEKYWRFFKKSFTIIYHCIVIVVSIKAMMKLRVEDFRKKNRDEDAQIDEEQPRQEQIGGAKYKGDLRQFLNERRALNDGDRTAGDHINHTDATKVLRAPQRAHEHAENLIKTAHVTAVSTRHMGRNPVSSAIVPVAEALARVAQDLKAAKNTVVDQALPGTSKGSAFVPGMMNDSALAAAVRTMFAKNNAAITLIGQVDKVERRSATVGSQLEANVALNATGNRPTAGVIKATVAHVNLTKKTAQLIDTAVQDEEQELEDVDVVRSADATSLKAGVGLFSEGVMTSVAGVIDNSNTTHASAPIVPLDEVLKLDKGLPKQSKHVHASTISTRMHLVTAGAMHADVDRGKNVLAHGHQISAGQDKIGVGAVSTTKSNNWKVVNKSPSKKQTPMLQNQIVPSKAIGVSNSFDALVNEGEHVNEEQHMGYEIRPDAEKTNFTGSEKEQKNEADSVRLEIASGGNHNGETSQIHAADTPTLHISNSELDKMVNDVVAAMMMNTTPKICQLQYSGSSKQQLAKNTGGRLIVSKDIVPVDAQKAMAIKSKLWDDQREYDDEEDCGVDFAGYSSEEADHEVD